MQCFPLPPKPHPVVNGRSTDYRSDAKLWKVSSPLLILGIESSCDETAAAVVEDGRRVLSNRVASQIPMHQRYGGVVPEIASRAHVEQVIPMVEGALSDAGITMKDLDAVAVTRGPGLIGCLLVGVEFAKSISLSQGIPLVAVQHVSGHLMSPWLGTEKDAWGTDMKEPMEFQPYIGMAMSGGHSSIVKVNSTTDFEILGETLDDAVGEAYDKVAKLIGLGYPGGPIVDQRAPQGDPKAFQLPRPMLNRSDLDFSFSGLKTAFAREVEKLGGAEAIAGNDDLINDLCASFQAACIDVIISKGKRALKAHGLNRLAIVGGVACNRGLRAALGPRLTRCQVAIPHPDYCTDNAAMIAGAGYFIFREGATSTAAMNATAQLDLSANVRKWQA